ncbi:globin-like [Argonauta hians]
MGAVVSLIHLILRKPKLMPAEDEVDPATGLMRKEKDAITQSWQYAQRDQVTAAKAFFEKLFTVHKDYIEFFPKFKGKKLEEIREMVAFEIHAKRVFGALNAVVENLDSPETLVNLLQQTGKDHKMRGVPKEAFQALSKVFIDFMSETLGSSFTPLAKSSWTKALDVVMDVCIKSMEEE